MFKNYNLKIILKIKENQLKNDEKKTNGKKTKKEILCKIVIAGQFAKDLPFLEQSKDKVSFVKLYSHTKLNMASNRKIYASIISLQFKKYVEKCIEMMI